MLLLLLSLWISLVAGETAMDNPPVSCDTPRNGTSCWRYPEELEVALAPTRTTGAGDYSENRVFAVLLCHLDCLERGEMEQQDNQVSLCQQNCSNSNEEGFPVNRSRSMPVSIPYLMEWNQDGVYTVTIPNDTEDDEMTSSGSDVLLIGDEDTGNEGGNATDNSSDFGEFYLVRVSRYGNHTYFPLFSESGQLDLSRFSCSEVNVSYAVLSVVDKTLSHYSPPLTTCVFIAQVDPPAAENLMFRYGEIVGSTVHEEQAIVYITWDSPSRNLQLSGYELRVTYNPIGSDKDCIESSVFPVFSIDKDATNFMIEPTGDRATSLVFACVYDFKLISLPGTESVTAGNTIAYSKSERRSFTPRCEATYIPSTVSYNVSISWTIEEQLISEAIDTYAISLNPTHFAQHGKHTKLDPEDGQRDFVQNFDFPVLFTEPLELILQVVPFTPSRHDPFFWRKSLIPNRKVCKLIVMAQPPVSISSSDISTEMTLISASILTFTLFWSPPTYINGELERYEICIGEMAVNGGASCTEDCLYLNAIETTSSPQNLVGCVSRGVVDSFDQPSTEINYHIENDIELLLLQIRTVNTFDLPGEWSDPLIIYNTTLQQPDSQSSSGTQVWIYVVVAMLCLVVIALATVIILCIYRRFCFHRRIKFDDPMHMERLRREYYPPSFIPVVDEWEVPSEDVEIFYTEELGHGAFGRVYRGLLHSRELRDMVNGERRSVRKRGSLGRRRSSRLKALGTVVGSRLVAIKRLRENIEGPDKASFLKEIEMMKRVSGSEHDHQKFVVNMLACVTVQEPMMLVLEYATNGDLLSYLRNSRDKEEGDGPINPKAAPYLEPKGAYSQLNPRSGKPEGEGEEEEEEEDHKLTEKDLLSFARQIAAGMEFLSSLSVVHRDMACRNILVCDNRLIKISDFGLSRTLVNQEAYVTTTKGVLPIRWMAPEALFYRTYDSQSDVWSYGIVLWELYTLGGYPYPAMSNRDIIERLSAGYRMDQPDLCSDQVYNVMLKCWSNFGVERPSFQELYVTFDNILTECTQHQSPYIQLLGTCYYDKLGPRVQVSDETLDLDNAPANVDLRPPVNGAAAATASGGATEGGTFMPSSLPAESTNGFLSIGASQSTGAGVNHRSMFLQGGTEHHATAASGFGERRGLGVPLQVSRPRSWVGTSTAELSPRYVPAPLYLAIPHSSSTNIAVQETDFGTMSPEHGGNHRHLQSRSVGSLPLLVNSNNTTPLHSNDTRTTRL